jgi:hypothetical protein
MHYWPPNKIFILWLVLFLPLCFKIQAQEISFVQLNKELEFTLSPGEEQEILLSFLIKDGFHIQANQVKDENLIPSSLIFDHHKDLLIGIPAFPPTVEFRMEGAEEDWHVYSDILEINVPVKILNTSEKREIVIKGKLHYQACDASKCYFPRDLPFNIKINLQK